MGVNLGKEFNKAVKDIGKTVQTVIGGAVKEVSKIDKNVVKAVKDAVQTVEKTFTPQQFATLLSDTQNIANSITLDYSFKGLRLDQLDQYIHDYLPLFLTAPYVAVLAMTYSEYLEFQKANSKLPRGLCKLLAGHYDCNLDDIRFGERINTVHGHTMTWGNKIFFTGSGDFYKNETAFSTLLHELEHVVQFGRQGGKSGFLMKYLPQGGAQIPPYVDLLIRKKTFSIHDNIDMEVEAIDKERRLKDSLWRMISAPVFNDKDYLNFNSDVRTSGTSAYDHWLQFGIDEGRKSSRQFDIKVYLSANSDLSQRFGQDYRGALAHYILIGKNEKRTTV